LTWPPQCPRPFPILTVCISPTCSCDTGTEASVSVSAQPCVSRSRPQSGASHRTAGRSCVARRSGASLSWPTTTACKGRPRAASRPCRCQIIMLSCSVGPPRQMVPDAPLCQAPATTNVLADAPLRAGDARFSKPFLSRVCQTPRSSNPHSTPVPRATHVLP